jgi:cytochrome P450
MHAVPNLEALAGTDPHAVLAKLRAKAPACWVESLGGWLVTAHALALTVMRDSATFTVDDPRFSTAQVIGPSMLSLDGDEHRRHRRPFLEPFRLDVVESRFAASISQHVDELLARLRPLGEAELSRSFAGPLAASVIKDLLTIPDVTAETLFAWCKTLDDEVSSITAGAEPGKDAVGALQALRDQVERGRDAGDPLSLLNAAVGLGLNQDELLANGVLIAMAGMMPEATILNAVRHLLLHPDQLELMRAEPALASAAVAESQRLEPSAAFVDRYATRATSLGDVEIQQGDLVRVSLAAASRDPEVFDDPDRFDIRRASAGRHVAFARGPHTCIGLHLARLEASIAVLRLFDELPVPRLDPSRDGAPLGLVFRKPPTLYLLWET